MRARLRPLWTTFGVLSLLNHGCGADPRTTAQPVSVAQLPVEAAEVHDPGADQAALGLGRVRLNLVSRLDQADVRSALAVESVKLCQQAVCFEFAREVGAPLAALERDSGLTVADLAIPDGEIEQLVVRLRDDSNVTGTAAGAHTLVLAEPVLIEAGLRTELYVALAATGDAAAVAPRFVTAALVPMDSAVTALVEPGRGATLATDSGFVLELAARSVRKPTVVAVAEDAVGGISSQFTLWPNEPLDAPARVTIPVQQGRIPAELALSDYRVRLNGEFLHAPLESTVESERTKVQVEVEALGELGVDTTRAYAELADGTFIMPQPELAPAQDGTELVDKANTDVCRDRLRANLPGYLTTLRANVGLRIRDCETTAPFVHIVLVNLAMTGLPAGATYPEIRFPTARNAAGSYLLRTMSQHMAGVGAAGFAGINGFTWSGGDGSADGQTGTFNGTVFIRASQVGRSNSNESIIGFSNRSGAGTTSAQYTKTGGILPELPPNHWHAVGSTTSILRNSACTRNANEGGVNRWSAIGIGGSRLAMVSSTSSSTTSAFELCSVFSALGSTGAIRLDGGPSSTIFFSGAVLNPLSGAARLFYGPQRRILYPVAGVR